MNFELKLAWAYFRARRRSTARFTAIVAVAAIACGVASLIVVQALTRGFSSEMQEKILSNTEHITVFQASSREIPNWQIIKREIEKIENVRQVLPTTYENALISGENAASYAVLKAVQSSKFKARSSLHEPAEGKGPKAKLEEQSVAVALGDELAEKTGLKAGDKAEIVLPSDDYRPRTVRIAETFRTGIYDYDSAWIYISTEDFARAFANHTFSPTVLSVTVGDAYAAGDTARKIRERLPTDFKVVDWQQANRPLFAALSMEKKVTLAVISLMILIAALNITTTLALLVNERKLDIAVLRTSGARARSLISIFLLEGLFLGLSGISLGAVSGLLLCAAGNHFEVVRLPAEVYSLSYVPLILNFGDILLILTIAFLLSLAATVYPAWRAAKIKPLENLRRV